MGPLLTVANRVASAVESAMFELAPEDEKILIRTEREYQDLQSALVDHRQKVAVAIAIEKNLDSEQVAISHTLELLSQRASKRTKDQDAQEKARIMQEKLSEIERDLAQQRIITRALRQELTRLEQDMQKRYTEKQLLFARHRFDIGAQKADNALQKLGLKVTDSSSFIQRMEKIVQEHEEAANKAQVVIKLSDDEIQKLDKRAVAVACSLLQWALEEFANITAPIQLTEVELTEFRREHAQHAEVWQNRVAEAQTKNNEELIQLSKQRAESYLDAIAKIDKLVEELNACKMKLEKSLVDLKQMSAKFQARLSVLAAQEEQEST